MEDFHKNGNTKQRIGILQFSSAADMRYDETVALLNQLIKVLFSAIYRCDLKKCTVKHSSVAMHVI